MDKAHILAEIRRTATANGGAPLGRERFLQETGIKQTDLIGRHWARWGDALKEAGFAPNQLQTAIPEEVLLERYIGLMRELGRFPVNSELLMKERNDKTFPTHGTFARFGSKQDLTARLSSYSEGRQGYEDIVTLCDSYIKPKRPAQQSNDAAADVDIGFVYLIRSGRYFKIGRTNAAGRRERELAIQLPEKANTVHVIRTDDPAGIETYWHRRFDAKRKNGEWFDLSSADVTAFKRRKFM